jgi:hypothetical protein
MELSAYKYYLTTTKEIVPTTGKVKTVVAAVAAHKSLRVKPAFGIPITAKMFEWCLLWVGAAVVRGSNGVDQHYSKVVK